jgi:hypothetical protein
MKSKTLGCVILIALAGCESSSEPERPFVTFQFGVNRPAVEPAFLIAESTNSIVLRGYLSTIPCGPYHATASGSMDGAVLTVRVIGHVTRACQRELSSGGLLFQALSIGYQAVIQVAPTAVSRLVVIHEWRDLGWSPTTVVDTLFAR